MIKKLLSHKEWIFSGIGVTAITPTIGFTLQIMGSKTEDGNVVHDAGNRSVANGGSTVVQVGRDAGSITIEADPNKAVRDFKKFVPRTYLDDLPRFRRVAHTEAREYYRTGVTVDIILGNNVITEKMFEALVNLSETAYTEDFFEGQSPRDYHAEQISRLTSTLYDGVPRGYLAEHRAQTPMMVEEFIVRIVEDVSDPEYFLSWKERWDQASKFEYSENR